MSVATLIERKVSEAVPVAHLALENERQAKGGEVSESPDCLGGSKHDPEFKA